MENNNQPKKKKGIFGKLLLTIFGISLILACVVVFMYFVTPQYFNILPFSETLERPIEYIRSLF